MYSSKQPDMGVPASAARKPRGKSEVTRRRQHTSLNQKMSACCLLGTVLGTVDRKAWPQGSGCSGLLCLHPGATLRVCLALAVRLPRRCLWCSGRSTRGSPQ